MRSIFLETTFLFTLVSFSSGQFLPFGVFHRQPAGCHYPSVSDGTYIYFHHPSEPYHYSIYTPWKRFYPDALRADLAEQGFEIGAQRGANDSDLCGWQEGETVKKNGWLRGRVSFRHIPGGGVKIANSTKVKPPAPGTMSVPLITHADALDPAKMAVHLVNHTKRQFPDKEIFGLLYEHAHRGFQNIQQEMGGLCKDMNTLPKKAGKGPFADIYPQPEEMLDEMEIYRRLDELPEEIVALREEYVELVAVLQYHGLMPPTKRDLAKDSKEELPPSFVRMAPDVEVNYTLPDTSKVQGRQEHGSVNQTLDGIHRVLISNSPDADILFMMLEIALPIVGVIAFLTLTLLVMRYFTNKMYPDADADSKQGDIELSSMRKSGSVKSDRTLVNPPMPVKTIKRRTARKENPHLDAKHGGVFAWRMALEGPAPPLRQSSRQEDRHPYGMPGGFGSHVDQHMTLQQPPPPRQSSSLYSRSIDGITLNPERNIGGWESH